MSTCDSTLTPVSQTASSYSVCWVIIRSLIFHVLFLLSQRFDEICVNKYQTGYSILWWGPLTSNCNFTKTVSYGDLTCVYAYTCCSSNDCNKKNVVTAPTTISTTPDTTTITSTAQENSTFNPIHLFLLLSIVTSCSFELPMN